MAATEIDPKKLEAFMGQAVTDMGAVISAPLFVIGERMGLYKAMAGHGLMISQEVAEAAGVTYDAVADAYELPPEQAMALADEESPFYLLGADIGCGHGASTVLMAEAFPDSEFHGSTRRLRLPPRHGQPGRPRLSTAPPP